MYACSGHYAIGFPGPMRSLNTLNSIDNNQNNRVFPILVLDLARLDELN